MLLKSPNCKHIESAVLIIRGLAAIVEKLAKRVCGGNGLRRTPIAATSKTANHDFLQIQ